MLYNKDPVLPFQYKDRLEQCPKAQPKDCLNVESTGNPTFEEIVQKLENNRTDIFEKATVNISKAQKVQARNYNKRNSAPGMQPLKLYDKCLKKNMKAKSRKEKMLPKFTGPYLITGQTQGGFLLRNKYAHQLKRSVPAAQLVRYYGSMPTDETISGDLTDSESEDEITLSCQRTSQVVINEKESIENDDSVIGSGQIIIMGREGQESSSAEESLIDVGEIEGSPNKTNNPWGDIDVNDIPIEIVEDLHEELDTSDADEEIEVERPDKNPPQVIFSPLDARERAAAAKKMCVCVQIEENAVQYRGKGKTFTKEPVVSIQAKPDGACLFNTMSLLLTGSDVYSFMFRHAICNFICDPGNQKDMRPHVPTDYKNGAEYIQKTGRRQPFSWGTETEIFAFCIMTRQDVMVYSRQGKWLIYSVAAKGERTSQNAIFINNMTGNHFDPVFSAIDY